MTITTGRRPTSTSQPIPEPIPAPTPGDGAHHILKVHFRRHHVWWVWELVAVRDDGSNPVVLTRGACLRKKTAWSAVHSWQRIYLRRLGRY
jgi:hypothetical protein